MSVFLVLSIIACSSIVVSSGILAAGMKKMKRLGETTTCNTAADPLVSIIVPACNEEEGIEKSVESLLGQEYGNLEIIVVNDRSTDNTAQVLQQLLLRFPRLHVLEIDELPQGWMGKSHALFRGAALAKGQYLLFTDADVILEKTTIARAVEYMVGNGLDHLTLVFKNLTRGWLLNTLILDAGMGLLVLFRPWLVNRKRDRFIGIGAFNMVKRSVYQAIGGHKEFRMHPIDDLMLGKIIKQRGFCQDCLLAYDFVFVPWYDSVSDMIAGLEKNVFAFVHYRFLLIAVLLAALVVSTILPVWGAIFGTNYGQALCLVAVGVRLAACYKGLRLQGLPWWYLPGFVITPYISCYITINSVFTTMRNRGIIWRGQYYALTELRKTAPVFF